MYSVHNLEHMMSRISLLRLGEIHCSKRKALPNNLAWTRWLIAISWSFMLTPKLLPRSFYLDPPDTVSRNLLGKLITHRLDGERLFGRIVEVVA